MLGPAAELLAGLEEGTLVAGLAQGEAIRLGYGARNGCGFGEDLVFDALPMELFRAGSGTALVRRPWRRLLRRLKDLPRAVRARRISGRCGGRPRFAFRSPSSKANKLASRKWAEPICRLNSLVGKADGPSLCCADFPT
jgi:hypothetical protein